MVKNNVFGTILLAEEGINGTISGLPKDVRSSPHVVTKPTITL
jgi:predicted sulfurtransferase